MSRESAVILILPFPPPDSDLRKVEKGFGFLDRQDRNVTTSTQGTLGLDTRLEGMFGNNIKAFYFFVIRTVQKYLKIVYLIDQNILKLNISKE